MGIQGGCVPEMVKIYSRPIQAYGLFRGEVLGRLPVDGGAGQEVDILIFKELGGN